MGGAVLTFQRVAAKSAAVLYAWHPGTMGGAAITDVLSGDANPSGRLPITFPRTVGQIPIYYAQLNTGRPAPAGLSGIPTGTPLDPQGYTSKYLDVENTPEYPFGFGLSYTTFSYSPARVSRSTFGHGESVTISAEVANPGTVAG